VILSFVTFLPKLMKRYLSRLFALVLVVVVGLMGCSSNVPAGLSGDYRQDTLAVIETLRSAINLPNDSPDKAAAQAEARQLINDFASRYRRDDSLTKLSSFTTMRTALNSLAGHYSSYPNRPLPKKLQERLEQEFSQVEVALKRGA
jgi:photosystem II Psb27 protein